MTRAGFLAKSSSIKAMTKAGWGEGCSDWDVTIAGPLVSDCRIFHKKGCDYSRLAGRSVTGSCIKQSLWFQSAKKKERKAMTIAG